MPSVAKKYKILFVTPEVVPFVKTGGVADVSSALPQKLEEMGHQVRIFVPKYGAIDERKYKIHEVVRLKELKAQIGDKEINYSIRSSFLVGKKSRVQIYFLDNDEYFGKRHTLYYDPLTKKDFEDNDERFILFCHSVFELICKLGWVPDIIHCNDWQTSLIPLFLKTTYKNYDQLKNIKTLLTIHNMSSMGEFPTNSYQKLCLSNEYQNEKNIIHKGKLNFLKAGLIFSDMINTVSEKYAKEIFEDKEVSGGLNKTLIANNKVIYGIINGIEKSIWNPATDKIIAQKYNINTFRDKIENKKVLLEKFGLDYEPNVPVISMITKLVDVKGINLVQDVFEDLMKLDIKFIILGTGEKKYHKFVEEAFMNYPNKFSCYLGFDDELAHHIEAGSDMLLMPSKYEPCGLNQMYSLIYGTVPIVREIGGLADTVKQFDENTGKGNGFLFKRFYAKEMLKEIKNAVKIYQNDKMNWEKIIINGMKEDFDWLDSATKYFNLYKKMLG